MNTLPYPKFEKDGTKRGQRHCELESNLNIFFSEADAPHSPEAKEMTAKAKAVCAACPYQIECAAYALDHNEEERGVWGGMSEEDRRNVLRRGKQARIDLRLSTTR